KPDPAPAAPKADTPAHAAKAGAFAVPVVATANQAEAEKLAAKLEAYQPRVETADVPGKGRFYRVRVGSFGSKPEAEKFLKTFVSKTGSKGLVVAGR
ncbi:MAG TPA: SPOR domain-containing protein, partial [Anaeromyxobacteraceae bacterium]|nr:SPOR domain-containing protein [Anaeromyxobacteraceae bacterium]